MVQGVERLPLEEAPISAVSQGPGPYAMSFGFNLDPLRESIRTIGMVNPPLVRECEPGQLIVVAGFRRFLALKALGRREMACRVLPGRTFTNLECLLLSFYDNLGTRVLNDVEKGMCLTRLLRWVPEDEVLREYMPLLGLPSHRPTLHLFCTLDQGLEPEIKEAVAWGRLSLKGLKQILPLTRTDRMTVFSLISELKLNINQTNQLIDYLNDLSQKHGESFEQLLGSDSIQGLFSDPASNRPQKARALLRELRSRRLPTLVAAEKAFGKKVARLPLPQGVSIKAPPYFEGPDYRLEILFRQGRDLREKVERLARMSELGTLAEPGQQGRS